MKTFILTAMLAVTAVSGLVIASHPVAAGNDPVPPQKATAAAIPKPGPPATLVPFKRYHRPTEDHAVAPTPATRLDGEEGVRVYGGRLGH